MPGNQRNKKGRKKKQLNRGHQDAAAGTQSKPLRQKRARVHGSSDMILKISPDEWKRAQAIINKRIDEEGEQPPFKIDRKDISLEYPGSENDCKHSFLVFKETGEDGVERLKIGALSRARPYFDSERQVQKEGYLGQGGFGLVKVVQWKDGSSDAVKIERWGGGKEEMSRAEQKAENGIMKKLGVFKFEMKRERDQSTEFMPGKLIKDKRYLVQTRRQGMELGQFMTNLLYAKKDLTEIQKRYIALEMARSIRDMHEKGIIHCDIKQNNFMIDIQGKTLTILPVDFGFSKDLYKNPSDKLWQWLSGRPITRLAAHAGTPGYTAPELGKLGELATYSTASDVYALGKTLEELDSYRKPPIFQALIKEMMNPDPKQRPDMDTVVQRLESKLKQTHVASPAALPLSQKKGGMPLYQYQNADTPLDRKQKKVLSDALYNVIDAFNTSQKTTKPMSVDTAAEQVIEILVENQKRHQKEIFLQASRFNLQALQLLPVSRKRPEDLQGVVCQKLGINSQKKTELQLDNPNSINNRSNRKKLAEALNNYIQVQESKPDSKPPPSSPPRNRS